MTAVSAWGQAGAMAAAPISVRANIDSAAVTMTAPAIMHVQIIKPAGKGTLVNLPKYEPGKANDFGGAEVREITVDSTALPNGRMQVDYTLRLQPFEVGNLTFPAFKVVLGADTFRSEVTTLKVLEPEIPKVMRDSLLINPMQGPASIKARWYDYVPSYWYWVVIALALIALGVVIFTLYKKNGPGLIARKVVVPPHVLALNRLRKLKARKLPDSGRDKEYYTELTDILRQYLSGRFRIYALEMSSTEILNAIATHPELQAWREPIATVLSTADFVKFAKQRPTPDENTRSFNIVADFVEKTKPVEEPPTKGKGKKTVTKRNPK